MVVDEKAQIKELRDKFLKKLKDEGPPGSKDFHPADIERITTQDDWLKRFLEQHENNVQDALKMLWETCEWRRNFGTNDITEKNVRMDYLEHGVCYSYGRDKDGKKLFVVKSKLHSKGSKDFNELQRCIVYWFERLEREENGDQISLFFDMIDAGLSNMDMELTRYLIGLFKNYYPNFLNYIIILEMPWILNATFNIIKSWLPAKAIPKIKFVKKSTLKEYVDPSVALKVWGGTNEYTFKFVPEAQTNGLVNGRVDNKKVHFAENSPLTEQAAGSFGDQPKPGQSLLSVEPEVLTFTKSGHNVLSKTITLKNNCSDKNITYKIKTTSPEKFKVRPNTGILLSSQSISVSIMLQTGYDARSLVPSDRFLIMCLPIENKEMTSNELIDFWKSNGTSAEQHKLICRLDSESSDSLRSSLVNNGAGDENSLSKLFTKISQLQDEQAKLQSSITSLKRLFLFFGTLVIIVLSWLAYSLNKNDFQNFVKEQSLPDSVESILPRHDEI